MLVSTWRALVAAVVTQFEPFVDLETPLDREIYKSRAARNPPY
jgi:hypothetical protein